MTPLFIIRCPNTYIWTRWLLYANLRNKILDLRRRKKGKAKHKNEVTNMCILKESMVKYNQSYISREGRQTE